MGSDHALVDAVRAALTAHADPARASGQQRYMKSEMPFLGITAPRLRAALAPVLASHALPNSASWRATVRDLWDTATHREERYAAIAVLRHRSVRAWARDPHPEFVALLRHLITTGAWWDLVDDLASHCVGDLLRAQADVMTPILRGWATEDDLWLRRAAIISQLGSGAGTDTSLLAYVISGSMNDRDFFARKAIGWALREFSKTDAEWVRGFLAEHRDRLAPLSAREASKWLVRSGR